MLPFNPPRIEPMTIDEFLLLFDESYRRSKILLNKMLDDDIDKPVNGHRAPPSIDQQSVRQ